MEEFLDRCKTVDLKGKSCVVVGLGDNKYDTEYTLEAARLLGAFVLEHGGKIIFPNLEIHKHPIGQLETKVIPWANDLASYIQAHDL